MRKLFKILAPIAFVPTMMAPLSMTSCKENMNSRVKHLTPYLHEMTFDDYVYDSDFVTTKDAEAFGCSSVRNGNFYGRNFDYVFNDTPEFVVRVKANKEKHRHASIGIATHFGLREGKLLNNEYKEQLDLIPNLTLDGINDEGLICSHNVVSMESQKDGIVPETNPGDEDNKLQLHQLFVPRYILDNAATVDDAVRLLQDPNLNIKGNLSNSHFLHVMIAGKGDNGQDKTVIVEFFHLPDSTHNHFDIVYEEKSNNDQIMTNFYCNDITGSFENNKKNGEERFAILQEYYAMSNSFAGMQTLMQKVMYSKAYNYYHTRKPRQDGGDINSEWYSEFVDWNVLYPGEGEHFDYETYLLDMALFKQDYWNARILDYRIPPNPAFWQTTHNSTYDMETKHLRVTVQEQYETYFDYYL